MPLFIHRRETGPAQSYPALIKYSRLFFGDLSSARSKGHVNVEICTTGHITGKDVNQKLISSEGCMDLPHSLALQISSRLLNINSKTATPSF